MYRGHLDPMGWFITPVWGQQPFARIKYGTYFYYNKFEFYNAFTPGQQTIIIINTANFTILTRVGLSHPSLWTSIEGVIFFNLRFVHIFYINGVMENSVRVKKFVYINIYSVNLNGSYLFFRIWMSILLIILVCGWKYWYFFHIIFLSYTFLNRFLSRRIILKHWEFNNEIIFACKFLYCHYRSMSSIINFFKTTKTRLLEKEVFT
jgi:hypothetical protein